MRYLHNSCHPTNRSFRVHASCCSETIPYTEFHFSKNIVQPHAFYFKTNLQCKAHL